MAAPDLDCSIVTVAYRSADDLPRLVASVPAAAEGLRWHLVAVDNDGTDGLAAALRGHPGVTVVVADGNLGYSGGLNAALAVAPRAPVIVILNPDLTLEPGSLRALVEGAVAGAATVPRIRDAGGATQPSLRREPTVLRSAGEALFGDHWPSRPAALAELVRDPAAYESARETEWATGAALALPSAIAGELGPWDDGRFFLYSEETDYCRRLRAAGVPIRYIPEATVVHEQGGSGRSAQLDALQTVNKLRYYRKWHGRFASAAFAGTLVLHNALRVNEPSARASLAALFSRASRATLPGEPRRSPAATAI